MPENHFNYRANLLNEVTRYCEKTGRARSGVAATIMNDAKFFERIESGAGCTMDTYEKVMRWFQDNMPVIEKPKRKKQ